MSDPNTAPTAATPQLTDAQLKTLGYFAIGVASEGSLGPKNVAYHLSFAGSVEGNTLKPVANSGFSIGTLQTDLGAHPDVVPTLVDAYQTWAARQTPSLALSENQRTQTISDLQRNGDAIRADNGRAPDATVLKNLNTFLASDAGVQFVHDRDRTQIDHLMREGDGKKDHGGALHQLRQTELYKNASLDDQAKYATVLMKLENQAGKSQYPKILKGINDGSLGSVEDVVNKVDALLPNKTNKKGEVVPDYIESGVHHALAGTEVFNKLRAAQPGNPLHDAFAAVSADPLRSPVDLKGDTAHADALHQYNATKTLFLQNGQSPKLIGALDQDSAFGYNLKGRNGKTVAQSSSLFGADNDVVVFDGNGHGTAFVGGKWSAVQRDEVKRVGNADQSVDLQLRKDGKSETLLHVPTPAQLRERSEQQQPQTPAPDRAPASTPGPNDASHRNHALLEQIREGVRRIDQDLGKPYDAASERLSRAALAACRDNGGPGNAPLASNALERADRVALTEKGHLVVVEGEQRDPAQKRASVDVQVALATPVEQSDQRLQAANQAIDRERQLTQQQELARERDAPSRNGPALA
ncbi:XVIPCD domain-containing protein [uncultured Xanthomonas sp.]|uniref:XVIPCD domain-containing protein n=1 Tax=uncultured Xanthomonas sp. TaxID=152831 RepID=UPI0025FDA09B|nr:XVIPCD domain-containing protein [uncultured Xanthomonas sp.]